MILLRDVCIQFDQENPLLKDVGLEVKKGETFVIVGPSGKGKSVLLKTIAGLLNPTSGEVFIQDQNIHKTSKKNREIIFKKMGMVFQKNALFDSFTVFDNLAFPLRETTELKESEIKERVDWFLNAVGLSHAAQKYPDEISGGMQKRVGVARALILKPEIIFYDDPTAGLDPITSKIIIELIMKLNKEFNTTVMAITNDMNRAYQMATRMGVLLNNTLMITGTVEQTQHHQNPAVLGFIRGETYGA
jgi:phospholipid/cholesterol/gamma-HCH transport system ATP-binding protein